LGLKILQTVTECLDSYESDIKPINEMDIAGQLLTALQGQDEFSPEEKKRIQAEVSAFRFSSRSHGSTSTWGIYWSELASGIKQDGTPFYSPDIADIDDEIISYWMSRSEACKHPVMQARYADLSWEIGRYLRAKSKHEGKTGSTISITFCQRAIDAYLQCIEKDLFKSDYDAWIYISRALELSLAVKDQIRTEKSKATLFAFASKQEKERADWMWWQFENIVWSNSKALGLDDRTRNEVISLLNRILAKRSNHSDKEHFNPHEATSAADSLCRWFGLHPLC
jgi:hypothetical protein